MISDEEVLRGNNPWPEDSDYGKFWRRGFEDGRGYTLKELLPTMTSLALRSRTMRGDKDRD